MSVEVPPSRVLIPLFPSIKDFAGRVLRTAGFFPGIIATSWFRDRRSNELALGLPFSQHLLALGVDLFVPRAEVEDLLLIARHFGLVAVDEASHVHLQAFPPETIPRSVFEALVI